MNKKKFLRFIPVISFLILLCILIGGTLAFSDSYMSTNSNNITHIKNVSLTRYGQTSSISLPCELNGLSKRTPITLSMDINPSIGDVLYVKSVYAPLKVYANGLLIYEYGFSGTYPSFFTDPPTQTVAITLPASDSPLHITMEYLSPSAKNSLTISEPLLGNNTAILHHLVATMGFSLSFSVLQIFIGLLLLFITFFFIPFKEKGTCFIWLGLFGITTGIWTFSECNLTVFLTNYPSLLYVLAFMGLFSFPIPLSHFVMNMLDMKSNKLLQTLCLVQEFSLLIAIVLQLFGTLPFSKSMYYFHVMIPTSICILAFTVYWKGFHEKYTLAKQLFLPVLVLAIFSILEVLNYKFHFTSQFSLIFQIGIILFILMSEIIAGIYLHNSFELKNKNRELKYDIDIMEKQVDMQKERNRLLLEHASTIKEQRHDLRHQYVVLTQLLTAGDYVRLSEYISSLSAAIPIEQNIIYCENIIINAIVYHYVTIAEKQGISITIKISVPEHLTHITDNNLCVIIGNLLENAIEACERITEGKRFIHLFSKNQGDAMFITMNNSFNGVISMQNGKFLSHKRDEIGTGLTSIRSVAQKHGGDAKFETDDNVFLSSVYLRI